MSEWLPIKSHPHYEVSPDGRVRRGGKECGQWRNSLGYCMVRLSKPRQIQRVHRLVAVAFCPNPAGKPFVNHIDNNPRNNCADNLEWCTQAENLEHMTQQGRRASPWAGRSSPRAKLSEKQVNTARELHAAGKSLSAIGLAIGVSKRTAQRLVNGETYAHV